MSERLPSVLVLSRAYPNSVLPHQGPWVQRQTQAVARRGCRVTVIAPTPYWPAIPGPEEVARLRRVERCRLEEEVDVFHPRFLTGPGQSTYALEGAATYMAAARLAGTLHKGARFDVIHAHFSYPDGFAAIALGNRLRVPVVVTEHVLWKPWMDDYPFVRRQAVWTLSRAAARVTVSDAVRRTISGFFPHPVDMDVIPVGVDGNVFALKKPRKADSEERLLFVGWVNYIKGVDVLIDSLAELIQRRPRVRLTIVGGALFRHKRVQQEQLVRKFCARGLEPYVTWAGPQTAEGVAAFMKASDVLVLPSRRESCGSVLLEALACGTPVVATRCGGPDEIVTDEVGVLVPVEDAQALASGIERVLNQRHQYQPQRLRDYALSTFSWDRLAERYVDVYRSVLS